MTLVRPPFADLHLHSYCSDGSDAPSEVVARAVKVGCGAMALTDHDSMAGVEEAQAAALAVGLGFLTGVEISTEHDRAEVHVLGFGVRIDCPALHAVLAGLRVAREERAARILERLREHEIELDFEAIRQRARHGNVGRIHIAQAVMATGACKTVQSVFDRYIGAGKSAYVPKVRISSAEAVDAIHAAGGLAFVAHPGFRGTRQLLIKLLELPFDGIEAYHTKHTPGQITQFIGLAKERGLLVSGGSDCHGTAKAQQPELGKVRTPLEYYQRIKERLAR